jgi:hypothetical protein
MGRCNTIYVNVDQKGWCLWHKQDDPGFLRSRERSFGIGGALGSR